MRVDARRSGPPTQLRELSLPDTGLPAPPPGVAPPTGPGDGSLAATLVSSRNPTLPRARR
jgi:hypothetical protein